MSESIIFTNQGEIDPRVIKSFGVSAKEGDNPIGFFGTGLKYALAIFMRLGHEVTIYSGVKTFSIGVTSVEIRGKTFEFVTMNGEELGFTTELGKNWEAWQAFRELYCNCLDESGSFFKGSTEPVEGVTSIVVKGDEALHWFNNIDQIALKINPEKLKHSRKIEVFNKPSDSLFYKGIKVMNYDRPCGVTINVLDPIVLTEDRTVRDPQSVKMLIARDLAHCANKDLLKQILVSDPDSFEGSLDIDWWNYENFISNEAEEVLENLYSSNSSKMNFTARRFWKNKKDKECIFDLQEATLSKVESKQLEKCLRIMSDSYHDFNYPVFVVATLGEKTMAFADAEKERIVVSKECFQKGSKYLMSTLIEEFFHLKTGFRDESRELQTYLFDHIVTLIENQIGEPI